MKAIVFISCFFFALAFLPTTLSQGYVLLVKIFCRLNFLSNRIAHFKPSRRFNRFWNFQFLRLMEAQPILVQCHISIAPEYVRKPLVIFTEEIRNGKLHFLCSVLSCHQTFMLAREFPWALKLRFCWICYHIVGVSSL